MENAPVTIADTLRGRQAVPVAEAAGLLGIAASTLYQAVQRGDVPNAGLTGKGKVKRIPVWWLVQQLSPPAAGQRSE